MKMSYEEYQQLKEEYSVVPVYKTIEEDQLTPIGMFNKLSAYKPTYILESVGDPQHLGRYSFIGLETEYLTEADNELTFDAIEALVNRYTGPEIEALPSSYASIIGYMAYNSIEDIHPITVNKRSSIPKYQLMFSNLVIVHDHLKHRLTIIANVLNGKADDYDGAMEKIEMVYQMLISTDNQNSVETRVSTETNKASDPLVFHSNFAKPDYVAAVNKAKDYIVAGDIFQVVLSQKFTASGRLEGFDLYRNLRKENPSPYLSYIRFPNIEVLCSSPEMLVKTDGHIVETAPIAGTRAVKRDGKDHLREAELLNDEKELAEHLMLVDLGRNDIGKVSKPGTVRVPEYCQAKHFSKVMHLVSSVEGDVCNDTTAMDCLRATFPAGTVSGAPKLRAMEIIDELEPGPRDLYAGSLMMFTQSGQLNSCISIRTIQLIQNEIIVQAGGGIVYDSNPEDEYLEVLNKSRALFNAIEKTYEGDITYDFDYR